MLDKGEEGNKYLCAYYVGESEYSVRELRKNLKKTLPDYMIPAFFIKLESMPLTPNGKLDRKSLLEPEGKINTGAEYEVARNEVEEKLVGIWEDVLGVTNIGINDNFFELGGHSLKAIKLLSRINKEFNIESAIKNIFNNQTLKELAVCIEKTKDDTVNKVREDNIILLKKADDCLKEEEKNLFIIHDGSADVGGYIDLSSKLKSNIKCWGIKVDKEMIYIHNNLTIEGIAERYINIIKNIQPNGGYNIAGWSLGGIIAFEMVLQLEKNNEQIKNFLLIDSYINSKSTNYNKMLKEDLSLDKDKLNFINFIDNKKIQERISAKSTIEEKWDIAINDLSKEEISKIILKLPSELVNIIPYFEELELDQLAININIIRKLISASNAYKPRNKVKKQVVLYKAEESKISSRKWNNYFENDLIINKVPGNHYTIMKKGNVEYIADSINKLL